MPWIIFSIIAVIASLYSVLNIIIYQPLHKIIEGEANSQKIALTGTGIVTLGFIGLYFLLNYFFQFQTSYSTRGINSNMFYPVRPLAAIIIMLCALLLIVWTIRKHLRTAANEKNVIKTILLVLFYFSAILFNIFAWIILGY